MEEKLGRVCATSCTETNERISRAKTVTVDALTSQSFGRPELEAGDLFPGLPNDITLDGIVSKLPWSAFGVLSSVSRRWREAIESRQVFNARVRSNSTETLVVIRSVGSQKISLYSSRHKRCYHLPRIPYSPSLQYSGITSVDGKIYVLGGWCLDRNRVTADGVAAAKRVYVFDPAGQRKWRKCADMLGPNFDVRCGVVEGKIYVFHVLDGGVPSHTAEVYDPKVNAWSRTAVMPPASTCLDKVLALGEEMFLLGRRPENRQLLAYHTVKDEWRVVEHFPQHDYRSVFIAQGKFHLMTSTGIDVLDGEKDGWQHLHSHAKQHSKADAEAADRYDVIADRYDFTENQKDDVIAVNDELYFTNRWASNVGSFSKRNISLLRSRGFGSDRDELLWQLEAPFQRDFTFECTVQV